MKERPLSFKITAVALTLILFHSVTRFTSAPDPIVELYVGYWLFLFAGVLSTLTPRPLGQFAVTLAIFSSIVVETASYVLDGVSLGTFLAPAAFLSGVLVIADEKLQHLFYVPTMRWWETSQRYFLKASAKVSCAGMSDDVDIKNISTTGCLAHTSAPFEVNLPVQIKLNDKLVLDAVVVRAQDSDVGLKFNFKNRREEQHLRQYIRESVAAQAT